EEGIDGFTLGQKMQAGAERFGTETLLAEVRVVQLADTQVEGLDEPVKIIETSDGTLYGRTVILATGAKARKLGVEKEDELIGKGVNYCAACDGNAYRGKTVMVVGGGNSAAADALTLSRLAEKVYIVHRRDTLRATKIYHKPLMEAENVEFIWDSAVAALNTGTEEGSGGLHSSRLTSVTVKNLKNGELRDVDCDGVFVSVGRQPASGLFEGQLALDDSGYVLADESTRTSIPGVFAVGDVRTKTLRQVITAAADGAVASHYVEEYLAERNS
ncbi:MAG: FAD-dependent oxidoreductase, partial [Firmicutes bacterium]|nr:FAD-dependent oxidoreductase [Bacillota bacterium]